MKVLINRDWEKVDNIFQKKGIVILDNFLKPGLCEELQKFAVSFKKRDEMYSDYRMLKLAPNKWDEWFPLLQDIVDDSKQYIPFLREYEYNRGWYYDYNYISNGPLPHNNPYSKITASLWVTTDDSMVSDSQEERNGSVIMRDDNRTYVPYKSNRMILMKSSFTYSSAKVRTHPYWKNIKVEYNFTYGKA